MLAFVLGALVLWLSLDAALASAFAQFNIVDMELFGLVRSTLLLSGLGALTGFVILIRKEDALRFTDGMIRELARVTWPSKDETTHSTKIVILTAIFVGVLLGVYDLIWKNVADIFLFTENG